MIDSDGIGLIFRAKGDTADARKAFDSLEKTINRSTSAAEKDLSGFGRGFNASAIQSAIGAVGSSLSSLGSTIQSVGTQLTVLLTLPLTALATLGVKSALSIDQVRTKITALVGDTEKANQKMGELRDLANSSVGVTQTAAFESFAQLKGIGGIADDTINKIIASMGKLNAAFKIDDIARFYQNLNQIFSQGFERSDIKEAIGRVPFFEQLLEQAFGTKDGAKLKQLKDSGKLTLDSFLSGMSEAIDGDSRISNIQENLSTKLAKGAERLNVALAPLGDVILRIVVPALEAAVPYIESLFNWFSKASPVIQTVIVAVGGLLAALGPALVVIGGVLAAVGGLLGNLATLGAGAGILAGLAVAAKFVGVAILAVIGIFAQLAVAFTAAAGLAYVLYQAWQTNFGGIQEFTVRVWATVKAVVSEAMQFIYGITQSVGGALVGWWRENYPLIKSTIETVSNSIKSFIQSFLDTVRGFWESHGSAIMNYVRVYWDAIKGIVSTVFSQIGNFIKLVMNVIRGDWAAAWENVKQSFTNAARFLTQALSGFINTLWAALKAIVPIIAEFGAKYYSTVLIWVGKAIAGAVFIIATLPYQIYKLIPKIYAVGKDIGAALYQGVLEGFKLAAEAAPINFEGDPNKKDGVTERTKVIGNAQGDATPQVSIGGGGGGNNQAEQRRKEREEAFKRELAAQSERNQILLQQERDNFAAQQKNLDDAFADKRISIEQYQKDSLDLIEKYQAAVSGFLSKQVEFDKKDKTGTELENVDLKYQQAVTALNREIAAEKADVEKFVTENQKQESEKRIADTKESLDRELELKEAQSKTFLAAQKVQMALGFLTEKQFAELRQKEELDLLGAKKANLQTQLGLVKGNAEQEAEINQSLLLLDEEITQKKQTNAVELAEFNKRNIEAQKANAEELKKLKREELEAERALVNFRAEQTRKSLTNLAENSTGKTRIKALEDLRDFEISEENRKQKQRADDLEAEKLAALEKIQGKANEAEQKFQIEELYKEKALISEAEFQTRLKEIRDSFNPQIETAEGESAGGGLFQGVIGGLGLSVEKMLEKVEPLKTIGNIIGSQFQAIAQGVGAAVKAFVLFGSAGGSFRKFAAEIVASVAQMAVVQAVWEAAQGFAMLALAWFTGNPKYKASAVAHFSAAAIYGAVGGVAAIAGRGLAGNAFKQESSGAFGSSGGSGGSNSSSGGGNRASGGAYSGQEDQVIEQGRNSPIGRETMVVTVKDRTGGTFGSLFEMEIQNNTRLRSLIQELASE